METGLRINKQIQYLNDPQIRRDILLLFVLPSAILIFIYLFPQSEQILEYKARNPTLIGIIGSNLAHRSVNHITGNIFGYWLLGGTGYLLMKESNLDHVYKYSLVAYLLILPFFANWTILQIFSEQPDIISKFESVGFSQTVGAVTGFLPIAISCYYSKLTDENHVIYISLGMFTLGFSVAFYYLGEINSSTIILGSIGILSILYIGLRSIKSLKSTADPRFMYLFGAVAFFIIGIQLLFPPSAPAGIYGHMAGYVWGYLLPIVGIIGKIAYQKSKYRS